VRLRGLPWSATKQDIADFLERCRVAGGTDGVIIIKDERWVIIKSPDLFCHFRYSREQASPVQEVENAVEGKSSKEPQLIHNLALCVNQWMESRPVLYSSSISTVLWIRIRSYPKLLVGSGSEINLK
jgi:hypothetical protein